MKNKEFTLWIIWFLLVILWNYGYPEASPLLDVIVAVLLSIINIITLRILKRENSDRKYF